MISYFVLHNFTQYPDLENNYSRTLKLGTAERTFGFAALVRNALNAEVNSEEIRANSIQHIANIESASRRKLKFCHIL